LGSLIIRYLEVRTITTVSNKVWERKEKEKNKLNHLGCLRDNGWS